MYYQVQKSSCMQNSATVGKTHAGLRAMYSMYGTKKWGVRAHLDPHTARKWGSGPQDLHRIASTAVIHHYNDVTLSIVMPKIHYTHFLVTSP